MSQEPGYDQTVVDLAISFLKDNDEQNIFNDNIDYGNADEGVPFDILPCILIYKNSTLIEVGPTGMDQITYELFFRVIIDKRQYFTEGDWHTEFDRKKLELLIEGNTAGTGQYEPNSIMGILRKFFTFNGFIINQGIKINYGGTASPMLDERTREGQITLTLTRLQATPNKQ